MRSALVLLMFVALTGCGLTEAIAITGAIGSIVCANTAEDSRADIRAKQTLQTDICGDLNSD